MNKARRFFTWFSLILFVLLAPLTLLAGNAERTLFSPQAYKQALEESGFYDNLPAILGGVLHQSFYTPATCAENPVYCAEKGILPEEFDACLAKNLPEDIYNHLSLGKQEITPEARRTIEDCAARYNLDLDMPQPQEFFAMFSPQDWKIFIQNLLPEDVLRQMFEQSIDNTFALLKGKTRTLEIPLDALSARLRSPAAVDAALNVLDAHPACTEDEMAGWTDYLNGVEPMAPPLCRPPKDSVPELKDELAGYLETYADYVPSQAVLAKLPPELKLGKQVYKLRLLLRLSLLLPIAFLMLLSILSITSPKTWLKWWGIPLALAGAAGLFFSFSLVSLFNAAALQFTQETVLYFPAAMSNALVNAVKVLLHQINAAAARQSFLLLLLGGGAWFGQRYLPEDEQP